MKREETQTEQEKTVVKDCGHILTDDALLTDPIKGVTISKITIPLDKTGAIIIITMLGMILIKILWAL